MNKIIRPHKANGPPIVKVAIPFYGHLPHPAMMLGEQLVYGGIPGYQVHILKKSTAIIHFGRVDLVEEEPKDYDFLFFVDADQGFDKSVMTTMDQETGLPVAISLMKKILDHDLNICGGVYVGRKVPHLPIVYYQVGKDTYQHIFNPPVDGVHEVGALGTGFLCIKKKVFDAFEARNREIIAKTKTGRQALKILDDILMEKAKTDPEWNRIRNAFDNVKRMIDYSMPRVLPPFWTDYIYDEIRNKYRKRGEDIFFCHEARKLGFKVYCDFGVQVGHESIYYPTLKQYRGAYMKHCIRNFRKMAEKYDLEIDDKGNPVPVKVGEHG